MKMACNKRAEHGERMNYSPTHNSCTKSVMLCMFVCFSTSALLDQVSAVCIGWSDPFCVGCIYMYGTKCTYQSFLCLYSIKWWMHIL